MTPPSRLISSPGFTSPVRRILRRALALAPLILGPSLPALEVSATFNSATPAAIDSNGYSADGNTVALSLAFAPPAGTDLILVNNTGPAPIVGRFSNLAQGQTVALLFNNVSYKFAANYHGGTGNDLILEWGAKKTYAWGYNYYGQLGNNGAGSRDVPVDISGRGVLAGKSVAAVSTGKNHSLALCTDGTLASWGENAYGQLGNGSTTLSRIPVPVTTSGVLAGKTVVAITAGAAHSFALCSDGTLAAWGYNAYRQLGNGLTANALAPVAINNSGALAGKTVTAVAAGADFSLALCSDGTLASWGTNFSGQLGIGSDAWTSHPPVAIQMNGILAGKRVVAISAGSGSSLALCADGTLASWGSGGSGNLGNGDANGRNLPSAVDLSGVLAGKTIQGIYSGGSHHFALCSDGTLAAWGYNAYGQLGDGSTTDRFVPVDVPYSGALAGRRVTSLAGGAAHTLALCQDGSLAAWGRGNTGALGYGLPIQSTIPVPVVTASLESGEAFARLPTGSMSSHAVVTTDRPLSSDATLSGLRLSRGHLFPDLSPHISHYEVRMPASVATFAITPTVAHVHASVTVNGTALASGTASPTIDRHTAQNPVNIVVTAQNGATRSYTFRVVDDSALSSLSIDTGILGPAFSPYRTAYSAEVPTATTTVRLAPRARDISSLMTVNGIAVPSGGVSGPISLSPGVTEIPVQVTSFDGAATMTYVVSVSRLEPLHVTLTSADAVPVTTERYTAVGNTVNLALGYAPATGTNFTLIDHTGPGTINGRFSNLAQGQTIILPFNRANYKFVANYHGGDGNDLVLQWAGTKAYAWGENDSGQLGIGSTVNRSLPTPVTSAGVLSGKTITAVATGRAHSLALCSDGTLAAWGSNSEGQLGSGDTTGSAVPVAVISGYGNEITAMAAGFDFSVVACSDGTLAAWGSNRYGQLGNGNTINRGIPSPVDTTGVLAGKVVVALAAGNHHVLALTSDGTLVAWGGTTDSGVIGNDRFDSSMVPVAVSTDGALAGKRVISIAAGDYRCGALCSDGTLVTWGNNNNGGLGSNLEGITGTCIPGTVITSGYLSGRTPVALEGGSGHFLIRCSDGTLASWGRNESGQLGNGGTSFGSYEPVAVTVPPFLAGKTVSSLSAGGDHGAALCSDGTLAMWGFNVSGQLGNGGTTNRSIPAATSLLALGPGEKLVTLPQGNPANHTLALSTTPLSAISSLSSMTLGSGILENTFNPGTTTYTARVTRSVTSVSVTATTTEPNATASINGIPLTSGSPSVPIPLSPGNRTIDIVVTAQTGTSTRYSVTFVDDSTLSSLAISAGTLSPTFSPTTLNYASYVQASTSEVTVTPTAADPSVSITINGLPIASGSASSPIPLANGSNAIEIDVTALDGRSSTYLITVVRPAPVDFNFLTETDIAVSSPAYVATGNTAKLSLGFAPIPGTALTLVESTGAAPISGRFSNLAHGQIITFTHANATYRFVANYHGGTGNDLVLQWADGKTYAWGSNADGQLGIGTTTAALVPSALPTTGVFAGKTVLSFAAGRAHSLAVFSNGTVAAWGLNSSGQIGDNTLTNRPLPVAVTTTGALSGKTVVAVAAGSSHSLALCSDGTVRAWGSNLYGQLGNNSLTDSRVPIAVSSGALAGKTVVAIAAGYEHSLALCSDGTLAAWGRNSSGQLGNGTTADSRVPVAVNISGIPAGKTITTIAAGLYHNLLLCSDGYLAAWGSNSSGQLGDGGITSAVVPVPVTTSGILSNKTVVSVAAGYLHSLARCSDGTLAAWGSNSTGQLGNGTTASSSVPTAVRTATGILAGRKPAAITSGSSYGLVRCDDGFLGSWGENTGGQLGNNSSTLSRVPVAVSTTPLGAGERFAFLASSGCAAHAVAFAASPLSGISTLSSLIVGGGSLNPAFTAATTSYSAKVSHGTLSTTVRPVVTNFLATVEVNGTSVASGSPSAAIQLAVGDNEIHVTVTAQNGTTRTYTILVNRAASPVSTLSALGIDPGSISPTFDTAITAYRTTVPAGTTAVLISPAATEASATVRVNGVPVASGPAGIPVPLPTVPFSIAVVVTAPDGVSTTAYSIEIDNVAPSFAGYAVSTPYETPVSLPFVKLLAKATDANGDALSITHAGPSAAAGTVVIQATSVSYTPPPGFSGTDTFPLTIRDSRGASVTGTVTIEVRSASAPTSGGVGMNPPAVTLLPNGTANVTFQGIPGRTYQLQRISGEMTRWTTLATLVADSVGRISFTDDAPPPGSAFYRISSP